MSEKILFTKEEMLLLVPVIVSDLKHEPTAKRRKVSNANIRRLLYNHVIRGLFEKERFFHEELEVDSERHGLYIKGYVRDVWDYLAEAYALIHSTNFLTHLKIPRES